VQSFDGQIRMRTVKRILCPIDLSPDSAEALRYAITLARTYDARLILCHAIEGRSNNTRTAQAGEPSNETFAELIHEHTPGVALDGVRWAGIVVQGEPAEAITREAATRAVDLIVMCSRRRPHRAALLGSTTEAVARIAPCPVFVTHPQEREWISKTDGAINLRRVLVAYDFSDDAELALRYALSLAEEYQAEVHLLHVLSKPVQDGPEIAWLPASTEGAYQQAARRLQKAVPADAHLCCRIVHSVRWGKPYRETLAYAAEQEIDLICMGAKGAGFGMSALFGSNVDRVLRQAPCPTLITRPLKPATAQAQAAVAHENIAPPALAG
jgi:nucleotide-binding universal stress UspA family protein